METTEKTAVIPRSREKSKMPENMTAPLSPALRKPEILSGAPAPDFSFQGIPGVEVTPAGTRFAIWYGGGQGEGPDNFLMLARSAPGDGAWHVTHRIVHPHPEVRCFDPAVWIAPDGRLLLFWSQSRSVFNKNISDGVNGVWVSVCTAPDAPLPAWSTPRRIADGIMLNKPIGSGKKWLLPVSVWADGVGGGKVPPSLAARVGAGVLVTEDGGSTFQWRGSVRIPSGNIYDEHVIAKLSGDRLLMLIRTTWGIAEAFSTDGGFTWSPASPFRFGGPNSRFALRRLRSGALLLVNHRERPGATGDWRPREMLTAYLSDDDGETWSSGMLIDPREGISYPDLAETADGTILCIYDRDRYGAGEILLSTFTEREVRSGKPAGKPEIVNALRR